jgi:hypothetical protein
MGSRRAYGAQTPAGGAARRPRPFKGECIGFTARQPLLRPLSSSRLQTGSVLVRSVTVAPGRAAVTLCVTLYEKRSHEDSDTGNRGQDPHRCLDSLPMGAGLPSRPECAEENNYGKEVQSPKVSVHTQCLLAENAFWRAGNPSPGALNLSLRVPYAVTIYQYQRGQWSRSELSPFYPSADVDATGMGCQRNRGPTPEVKGANPPTPAGSEQHLGVALRGP